MQSVRKRGKKGTNAEIPPRPMVRRQDETLPSKEINSSKTSRMQSVENPVPEQRSVLEQRTKSEQRTRPKNAVTWRDLHCRKEPCQSSSGKTGFYQCNINLPPKSSELSSRYKFFIVNTCNSSCSENKRGHKYSGTEHFV